ncbi:MAG TPA: hypothetical protein VFS75_01295 [Candidatus Paceibacterota bacterium]|nr:hypothetical protein [Candidatus Paceibacterota bacterium]
MIAYAADSADAVAEAHGFLTRLENAILFPLMTLMMAVAFLIFLWGGYEYIANAADDGGRETGRKHMLYGIIGLVIMVSAYGILKIAASTFGVPVE